MKIVCNFKQLLLVLIVLLGSCSKEHPQDQSNISEDRLNNPVFTVILDPYKTTDVYSLIDLKDAKDVEQVRKELLQVVFASDKLPDNLIPQTIQKKIGDTLYKNTHNLSHIDLIKFDTPMV